MKSENFLNYQNYRWLKISLIASIILSLIYFFDDPVGGPSGGSLLGYTYGGIATAGILYLMYYGMRKRSYFSSRTTLLAVLSAHSWIGISLLIIVPLHAGFSFGLNVHTLAYVLLLLVVLSGIWGSYLYIKLPSSFSSQRGGLKTSDLLAQIVTIDKDIEKRADELSTNGSTLYSTLLDNQLVGKTPSLWSCCFSRDSGKNLKKEFENVLLATNEDSQQNVLNFISLLGKRNELLQQLKKEVRTQTFLRLWLYLHLPVSLAMLLVVFIHIFSVFYYF